MKIGVISDTHIPKAASGLPEKVCTEFEKVDLILHAGDLVEISVLERLRKIAPVKAVCGNMDEREVRMALPPKEIVTINNKFKIGLMHGHGAPFNLIRTVGRQFTGVDAIVFGHSHAPVNEVHDGVLFFNPGSPTDKVFARFNSFGILEVGERITGKIIRL